jgi:hypothetical protein
MPYYSGNAGLIGPGAATQSKGVYDIDFTRLNPSATFTPASIGGFAAYMRGYLSEIRNSGFYPYSLDGDAFYIADGGGDMYDNSGNTTYPWFAANTPVYSSSPATTTLLGADRLSYATTTAQIVDTNMYYVSLGYNSTTPDLARPLSLIGTRTGTNQTIGFQKAGDSGGDGSGTLDSGLFYNANTVQGFTVTAFRRQTYATSGSDTTHCDIYMIIGHPLWGSVFGTINTFAHPVANGTNGGHCYMTGTTNVIAITSLLSRASGVVVNNTELTTVVDAWLNRLKLYYGV